jgi:hypothetical protein
MKFKAAMILLSIVIPGLNYAEVMHEDKSLTEIEYSEHELPIRLVSYNDFEKTFTALQKLADDSPFALPKFNSSKSGRTFEKIISRESIDLDVAKEPSYLKKRQLFLKYWKLYSDIAGLYLKNLSYGNYYNEIEVINCFSIHPLLSAFEMIDHEISHGNGKLPSEKANMFREMMGKEIWNLEFTIRKSKKIDDLVLNFLKSNLEPYQDRILKVNFLNSGIDE